MDSVAGAAKEVDRWRSGFGSGGEVLVEAAAVAWEAVAWEVVAWRGGEWEAVEWEAAEWEAVE